ncbi:isochorismatase family protein [Alkalispirochaeta alkalica]|uniref:isochorismatase family protein n=1 Tax=Alkalispirochaeta alkalica TaxID=46356 RepID=UPI000476E628|nr:isochorismatase family protein [Alkalispirochaeta alkalica]
MRITRDNTMALIIDVQERILPVIDQADQTVARIVTLCRGLHLLGVPLTVTEQYPQGLGATLPAVRDAAGEEAPLLVKASFSCCDDPACMTHLEGQNRKVVILAGIETHVCVLQTALDLLERGLIPVVPVDAVSSRNPRDRETALVRLQQEGARLTTTESILFELTRSSAAPEFRDISRLIR